MKNPLKLLAIVSVLGALVGCGSQQTAQAPQDPSTAPAPTSTDAPKATPGANALGSEVSAEHFSVTLTTDPEPPKVGETKFSAKVLHHGEPAEDVKVRLSLSMPTMNMGGPEVELKHTSGSTYEGSAKLGMGGAWQAKVEISGAEGHTGTATYNFEVSE